MNIDQILAKDKSHVWHPFSLRDAALVIDHCDGAYLVTKDGRRLFDGISSWWVNLHGHCHPHIVGAVQKQVAKMEQVIFAGATHQGAVELAERVANMLPEDISRIFYSDNGSTAVEVALKLAVQWWSLQGRPRHKFAALNGGYHGDTVGAMSVTAESPFTAHFKPMLFDTVRIDPPLVGELASDVRARVQKVLTEHPDLAGFIYEPLIQGAGGMQMQDPELLAIVLEEMRNAGVLCIADEVMTGFGRTGTMFASDQVRVKPDLICLSKGLSGGTLPISITACRDEFYESFTGDLGRAFLHGHSFTANPVACAASLASLDLLNEPNCLNAIETICHSHREAVVKLANHPRIKNPRSLGTVLAFEIRSNGQDGYLNAAGAKVIEHFFGRGIFLRPLGNTIYLIPPYCTTPAELDHIYSAMLSLPTEGG